MEVGARGQAPLEVTEAVQEGAAEALLLKVEAWRGRALVVAAV